MTTPWMISVTPEAVEHLLNAVATLEAGVGKHVRLSVISGGCSGFKYDWTFEDSVTPDDILIPLDKNTKLVIRNDSHELLEGSVIDLVKVNSITHEIKIINPSASAQCGCGESFS